MRDAMSMPYIRSKFSHRRAASFGISRGASLKKIPWPV